MNISSINKKIEISSDIKNNYDNNNNIKERKSSKSKIEVNEEENQD
jgi:hypothetical protein